MPAPPRPSLPRAIQTYIWALVIVVLIVQVVDVYVTYATGSNPRTQLRLARLCLENVGVVP